MGASVGQWVQGAAGDAAGDLMCPLESRVDSSKNHPRKGETMTTAEMATMPTTR